MILRQTLILLNEWKLTGKKAGGMGPPGIPSFGGIWLIGDGAGPAFCEHFVALMYNVSNINFV